MFVGVIEPKAGRDTYAIGSISAVRRVAKRLRGEGYALSITRSWYGKQRIAGIFVDLSKGPVPELRSRYYGKLAL